MESARDRPGTARCRGHGGEGPGAVPPSSLPPQHGHLVSLEPPPARPAALHRHRALNWRPPLIKLRCEPRTRAAGTTRWGGAGCPAVCLSGWLSGCLSGTDFLLITRTGKAAGSGGAAPGRCGTAAGCPSGAPLQAGGPRSPLRAEGRDPALPLWFFFFLFSVSLWPMSTCTSAENETALKMH